MNTSNSAVTMVSEETQSPLRYASDLIEEEWEILQPIIDELEPYTTRPISNTGKSRNPNPPAAIIDSQRIKGTPESYLESGFDGGNLIKGRSRYNGFLIIVRMCAANIFDGKAARQLITDMFSYRHKNLGR